MFKILGLLVIAVVSFQAKADELSDFKKARISFTAPKGWIRCERINEDGAAGVVAIRYGKHEVEKKGNSFVSNMKAKNGGKDDVGRAIVESHFRTRVGEVGGYPIKKFDKGAEQAEFVNLRKMCNDHHALFEGDANVSGAKAADSDEDDKDKDNNAPANSDSNAPAPGPSEN